MGYQHLASTSKLHKPSLSEAPGNGGFEGSRRSTLSSSPQDTALEQSNHNTSIEIATS